MFKVGFDEEPPKKPDKYEKTTWSEAIAWASLTGALEGTMKLIIRRGRVG